MAFSYSSFLIYLAYTRFGYQTFKSISSPVHDIDSPAGLKRRKLLLKWVCATIIIILVNFSDYTLGFLPTYYFWRGILFPLMIFDGTLATKIMMSFENHIEGVEKWTDRIANQICTVYNIIYYPTFISFIQKLDFVLSGCTVEQLDTIEKLVKTFKINIRKAKVQLEPKKNDVEESKEAKDVVKIKKRVMNTPLRNSLQAKWEADVKMMKVGTMGKRSFFPHKIQYDVKTKKLTWQAAGDDKSSSDVLTGVRFRDNSKLILEIQLETGNKTISFATAEVAETWAKFLESQYMDYPNSWLTGPISDKDLRPGHDKQIQAIAVHNDQGVTASADHSLRIWDLGKGTHVRQLFNKNFGHKDWVTCCAYLQDGRILSGGMDSMICLWDKRAVRCDNLAQHAGSVSCLQVNRDDVAVSGSYDKSLIVWDLHRLRPVMGLQATAPVTTLAWNNSLVISGERDGKVLFYDINTGKNFKTLSTHTSSIHKLAFSIDGANFNIIASVGKDGKLAVSDLRDNNCIFSEQVHRGAINVLCTSLNNTIITGSADNTGVIFDIMMGFRPRSTMKANSSIFCGEILGNLFVCGCADGNLIVFDMDTEEALFGFGADNVGGVNCLGISQNKRKLITGGDSGTPLLLNF